MAQCKDCIYHKMCYWIALFDEETPCEHFIPTADVVPKSEYESEIKILKDSNINLQELYQTEREKVAKAKQKVIDIGRALKTAKAEAIKEFAERLKAKAEFTTIAGYINYCRLINNLVKEMTEGKQ